MRFLLDHDVPVDISYSLSELGHEVVRLPEVLDATARDEQVLEYASRNHCVLISCNRDDFLRLARRKPHSGLIILVRRKSRAAERAALIRLIDKAGEEGIQNNVWEWFLGVQRQLPGDWIVEANYLGNAGRKLLIRQELNRYTGDRADGAVNRVNQSFASIIHGFNATSSIYEGLATQAVKRFSHGHTIQVAYTFSRSIDADSEPFGGGAGEQQGTLDVNNIKLDRGLSAFDATHRLTANFVYELPFLRKASGPVSLFGGWQIGGILSLQSGFPFTVVTSEDYNLDGAFSDRPNGATSLPRKVGDGPHAFLNGAFGERSGWGSLFVPAAPGANGTLGRNTFRGPGYAAFDLSLLKVFRTPWFTSEGSRWEFRAELFNLFNRVNLRAPSASLGAFAPATGLWSNVNFGRSLSSFDARQIQLAIKFVF